MRQQQGVLARPRGSQRGLRSGVAATYDDDIEFDRMQHKTVRNARWAKGRDFTLNYTRADRLGCFCREENPVQMVSRETLKP